MRLASDAFFGRASGMRYVGKYIEAHQEVLDALELYRNDYLAEAIRVDRKSELTYLGCRVPEIRKASMTRFSFRDLSEAEILEVFDDLWNNSEFAEVLFVAALYYRREVKKAPKAYLWPVLQGWSQRVENWAHCDSLGFIYSHLLETNRQDLLPKLVEWNRQDQVWLKRLSLVSLVHYTGKNSVFLEPEAVWPFLETALDDHRDSIQKALGWVLREMFRAHPRETEQF